MQRNQKAEGGKGRDRQTDQKTDREKNIHTYIEKAGEERRRETKK